MYIHSSFSHVLWIFALMICCYTPCVVASDPSGDASANAEDVLQMTPVKVTSQTGEPILTFYMTDSSLKPKIEVLMDSDWTATFDYAVICADYNVSFGLELSTENDEILKIVNGYEQFDISCKNARMEILRPPSAFPGLNIYNSSYNAIDYPMKLVTTGRLEVKLESGIIGFGYVHIKLVKILSHDAVNSSHQAYTISGEKENVNASDVLRDTMTSVEREITYKITVVRKIRPADRLFRGIVFCVQIFVATAFGAKLDLAVVKECLFRPIAPAIGLVTQFLLMPLIAFTVAKAVSLDTVVVSLGIFVAGCCPGGGGSNMYSYLLQGDLSLSITMTALSTVLSIGILPMWIYTLGRVFTADTELTIPFEMVAVSLSLLITPLLFGLFLRVKFPKAADMVQKALKPVLIIMSAILIGLGIYSNMYIFRLFKPKIVLAACLLPYIGYIAGGGVSALCKQPWTRVKTIAIETGMQNTNIAYILLVTSFPAPIGDIAAVAPVASAVMTPLPLFLITIVYLIYQRCKKKRCPDDDASDDEAKEDDVLKNEDGACEKMTTEMISVNEKTNGSYNEKDKLTEI